MTAKYKRILLKLSGESLMGKQGYGIDSERLAMYAQQIDAIASTGVEIGIVIGGGNIFRGLSGAAKGFDRVKGGRPARVLTSIGMFPIGEPYSPARALETLADGKIAIIAGGTGNPYFTTDTASALRAVEIHADVMLKGTRVDGIYTADPEKDPTATKFDTISYDEIYNRGLKIMDLTATTLCRENGMKIVVFDMDTAGNLVKVVAGEPIGTLVY